MRVRSENPAKEFMETLVLILIQLAGLYLMVGFLFSLYFIWKKLPEFDASTEQTSIGFKLLLLPGMTFLWIFFLLKWIKKSKQ